MKELNLKSATTSTSRSMGQELLVDQDWGMIELPKFLNELDFNRSGCSLAEAGVAAQKKTRATT